MKSWDDMKINLAWSMVIVVISTFGKKFSFFDFISVTVGNFQTSFLHENPKRSEFSEIGL